MIFLLTNRAVFCKWSQKSQFKIPGRSISVEVRARVIGVSENAATTKEAANQVGVHRVTVFRIKSKFLQTGSVKKKFKPGKPRSTTAVQDRFLRLTALRQRFKSSVKLTANLRRATWVAIHPRTVRNRLKSAGIKSHRPCLRNKLTPHHKRHWGGISRATSFGQTNRVSTLISTTGVNVYSGESASVMYL